MTDREEFLEIFRTHVTRPGSEKLLDWMGQQDGLLLRAGVHPLPWGL